MTPSGYTEPFERCSPAAAEGLSLELRSFSYDERRTVLPALLEAVTGAGGWLLDRQVLPNGRIEFWIEAPLRGVMDLYSAVVGSGLELTRAGHHDFTALCMLRKNQVHAAARARLLTIRLEVSFVDEDEDSYPMAARRAALA
jgi:hypothetical protein